MVEPVRSPGVALQHHRSSSLDLDRMSLLSRRPWHRAPPPSVSDAVPQLCVPGANIYQGKQAFLYSLSVKGQVSWGCSMLYVCFCDCCEHTHEKNLKKLHLIPF